MTYKAEGIRHKVPGIWLEVSRQLAEERGLEDGTAVRLTSPYGQVKVPVLITDRVQGKELYLPMHSRQAEEAVNRLTSSYFDIVTHTPNFKEMNVNMEIVEQKGEIPLPRVNHRFAERNPQIGVKVEEKWQRNDFVPVEEIVRKETEQHG
jgi:formate dehydrogenase major subunit